MQSIGSMLVWMMLMFFPLGACAADVQVLGDLLREHDMSPGSVVTGTVLVKNPAAEAQQIRIVSKDIESNLGTSSYFESGSLPRSNGGWVEVTPTEFLLESGQSSKISYTIRVPDDLSMEGSYWSVLLVEPVLRDFEPSGGLQVNMALRYEVSLVTHVNKVNARYGLEFSDPSVSFEEGVHWLQLKMKNVGEVSLRPMVWTELFDESGQSIGRFKMYRPLVHPGCTSRIKVRTRDLTPGKYTALVVADNDDQHVYGTQVVLDVRATSQE